MRIAIATWPVPVHHYPFASLACGSAAAAPLIGPGGPYPEERTDVGRRHGLPDR